MIKQGLSEKEVLEKRKKYGFNILKEKDRPAVFFLLLSQFKNPLIYILLAVGFVSLLLKDYFEFILIISVVFLNVVMGFFQEYSAQKTLYTLKKLLKPTATVIRGGQKRVVEAKELVPEDLVVLLSGDKIPADGKLKEGEIFVSEAILTGEEEGILKQKDAQLFMGTVVLSGKGIMEVEKIGQETEIGKIGKALVEIEREKTPLQEKLEKLSKKLTILILSISFFIFVFQIFSEKKFIEALELSAVLAVAAIPAALPIVITVVLALGMKKILKHKGLIKTLLATETLGSTSIICVDKTGTLTEGKMKVVMSEFEDESGALLVMLLNNEEKSSLEIALLNFARERLKEKADIVLKTSQEIFEEPFDSEKKYSLSVWKLNEKEMALLMGAPEIVLNFCQVEEQKKQKYLAFLDQWAEKGLRVLAFAKKEKENLKEKKDFEFLGMVGISDPIRKEAKEMIKKAERAGIKIKIITGDYSKTAQRVAQELGFDIFPENIMTGEELEIISLEELERKIDKILIFARVFPHQKKKIVEVLQKKGEVVAMTGDGVNDALALRRANIGIAVGEGSEVAKEAADLILLDSNFKTIILACEEGRLILDNIKKCVAYILSNSFLEIGILFLAGLLKIPPPLNIPQILFLHLICDGPPDLMFAFEPKEDDLMERKPVDVKKEPILNNFLIALFFLITVFVVGTLVFIFSQFIDSGDLKLASTLVFATLGSIDLIYAFSFKNLKKPIWRIKNFFENKFFFLGIFYGFSLLLSAIYLSPLNKILNTVPLGFNELLIVLAIGLITTLWLETLKMLFGKKS